MNNQVFFTPREIVSELDKYIIGQNKAKRAVAIALRNRWRRQRVSPELKDEIAPQEYPYDWSNWCWQDRNCKEAGKVGSGPIFKG